jgi:diphosphomevalonate decarboxylase
MKATAVAPANIAFIKYWGKKDEQLRLPVNSSISMNLSGSYTTTTVEFSPDLPRDSVEIVGEVFSADEVDRVLHSLDVVRTRSGVNDPVRVVTKNTFPKGAGAAASASGFAALISAGFEAAGVQLSEKELTVYARMGSGSACRSVPDGFVFWEEGDSSESSYAYSLYPADYWDIRDTLVIVDASMKKVSTTEGMMNAASSPLFSARLEALPGRVKQIRQAFAGRNFRDLGNVIEEDSLDMHAVMQTQVPPLNYWSETTRRIIQAVLDWRRDGIPVYATIDAGPNVHLIHEAQTQDAVLAKIRSVSGVQSVIQNKASRGAHLVDEHLF